MDKVRSLEMHDAAGVESEFIDWSSYDDGYGNNIIPGGDLSMQRMIERGSRDPWSTTGPGDDDYAQAQTPEGYDKEPFQSEAQRRKFHAMAGRGEISQATVSRWEHETPNKASLPMHKHKK